MKQVSNTKITTNSTGKPKFSKSDERTTPVKTLKHYQYTEKDLGEGILNMGITASYAATLRNFASA